MASTSNNSLDFSDARISDEELNLSSENASFKWIDSELEKIKNMMLFSSEMAMVSIVDEVLIKLAMVFARIEQCPSTQVFNPEIFHILREVHGYMRDWRECFEYYR